MPVIEIVGLRLSCLPVLVVRLVQVETRSVEVATMQVEDLGHDRHRHVAAPAADGLADPDGLDRALVGGEVVVVPGDAAGDGPDRRRRRRRG